MDTIRMLADALESTPGIVAVIGSGGKSTLLAQGASALAARGARVVLATSTHMFPPAQVPFVSAASELQHALARNGVACIGTLDAASGKLSSPACKWDEVAAQADFVLVEADGSKRLPLKAHAAWEPVIPPGTVRTVLVVGASGLGRPIEQSVHRPDIFCRLTGAAPGDTVTAKLAAAAIRAEGLVNDPNDLVVVNQAEGPAAKPARELARELAGLPCRVLVGSLKGR